MAYKPYVGIPSKIAIAARKRDKANECLRASIIKEYPVGAHIMVTLGRARIHGKITGYSTWDFGTVHIINTETGKARKFYATFPPHDVEVMAK